jgi:uncharacterized membrane protein
MKNLQKFILPLLIISIFVLIYFVYFSPSEGLGAFSDFDPNNNANKDIRVAIVAAKGITPDPQGGVRFYARDKHDVEVLIMAPAVPGNINTAESVVLRGHLHKEYFHAAEVIQ